MSVVVFAVPPPPPVAKPDPFGRLRIEWIGADGSSWNLTNPRGGVFTTQDGIRGLHDPAWEAYTQAAVDGQVVDDVRALPREFDLPIYLYSDVSSVDWAARYRSFFGSWDPLDTGTLRVISPSGAWRAIDLRLTSDGSETFLRDPYRFTRKKYLINAVADFPFYRGAAVRRSWGSSEPVGFFDPDGSPPFHISSTRTVGSAVLTNPGDQTAWIRWTAINTAGTDLAVSIGMADGTITLPPIPAGQAVHVDTNPEVAAGWEGTWVGDLVTGSFVGSTDVSGGVDPWDPRPIPPGKNIPIDFDMTGSGTVVAEFTPLYRRGLS